MKKKVVLAFSGGLDTSYCVKYLKHDLELEIHSVIVNTGGFDETELQEIERKAYTLGVTQHLAVDVTPEYYDKCIKYLLFGNVLKNDSYPLSVSSERTFQAIAIAEYAHKINADYIAHGSTGAGNDQVRFDAVFAFIAPEVEVITPIRDNKLSREAEIEYLKKHGVAVSWEKAKYSINVGLWGTSVGGSETLTSDLALPESAWPTPLTKEDDLKTSIDFKNGEVVGIDGVKMESVAAIKHLNKLAGAYAIGRDTHVGDTIIGIKGRVGFEAPAALILIKAHQLLEKHIQTKWQIYWKKQLSEWYGMLLHEGQYFEPVMRDIEAFLDSSQKNITGKVFVHLHPYRFELIGIESKYDLMKSKSGVYGEMNNNWTGEDVKGFTKIYSNQVKIWNQVNKN